MSLRLFCADLSQVAGAGKAPPDSVLAAIARMQEQLHRLVSQVATSAHSIASASAEITLANEDLSRRTEAQAASLEQTSASMEQLTATVKHNADNAHQGNQMATGASAIAVRGGEQGRGFAVVAGEVRILAQRSATAGSRQVDEAGSTMSEVVNAVKGVNELMAEITLATAEQHTGIDQVNKAVVQMDEATQQNAALVEQSAAAAASLKRQAEVLLQEIAAFDVSRAGQADRAVVAVR